MTDCIYNILWIDDEWDKMTSFKKYCLMAHHMNLVPFKTQKDGLDDYAEHPSFYDTVILDAKVFNESEHEVANVASLQKAVMRIKAEFKDLPYFISTGQPDLMKDETFKAFFPEYYEKEVDDEKLCQDIVQTIKDKPVTVIKNKYKAAFAIFDCTVQNEPVLDYSLHKQLITLVQAWDKIELRQSSMFYGLIRPIVEKLVKIMIHVGIIDETVPKWNKRSQRIAELSNSHPDEIPSYIARAFHTIFDVCPEGVHDCPLFDSINKGETPFLLQSITMELFNILAWFPNFITANSNREANQRKFGIVNNYIHNT